MLDGQQRLQSLFIALYGSHERKQFYFDLLSGRTEDDFSQQRYAFSFSVPKEAAELNEKAKYLAEHPDDRNPDQPLEYFISVAELFALGVSERQRLRKLLRKDLALTDEDENRVESNLAKFDEVLTKNENLLKASTIDENLPSDSPERKSEADVLEIFVRINRQGTALSRSDLIFSILKLRWKESAQALPDFVKTINKGNSLNLDTDFVIRCLFAVSNLGTRFDLELLRERSKIELLKSNYDKCCAAIRSTIDFVVQQCRCQSSRAIGGNATLIPLVYYLFSQPKFSVPKAQAERVRKAVFLLGFTQPFSRYGDSRLGAFLRRELMPLAIAGQSEFPFENLVAWVKYWERITEYGPALLQGNALLALHVVQRHSGAKTLHSSTSPEVDHIFPKSVLRDKGFDQAQIGHFANLWLLGKDKNGNKSAAHPAEYFKDVPAAELKRALIDSSFLDYRRYTSFLEERGEAILKVVTKETGLSSKDFQSEEA